MIQHVMFDDERCRLVAEVSHEGVRFTLFFGPGRVDYQATRIGTRTARDRLALRTTLNGIEGTALADPTKRRTDFETLCKTIEQVVPRPA